MHCMISISVFKEPDYFDDVKGSMLHDMQWVLFTHTHTHTHTHFMMFKHHDISILHQSMHMIIINHAMLLPFLSTQ